MKKAKVFYRDLFAGVLEETDNGYRFIYDDSYLKSDDPHAISLTLPLQETSYNNKVLFPFFDGLIPEGWLLDIGVEFWKIDPRDRFQLLLNLCRETLGAVTVQPFDNQL